MRTNPKQSSNKGLGRQAGRQVGCISARERATASANGRSKSKCRWYGAPQGGHQRAATETPEVYIACVSPRSIESRYPSVAYLAARLCGSRSLRARYSPRPVLAPTSTPTYVDAHLLPPTEGGEFGTRHTGCLSVCLAACLCEQSLVRPGWSAGLLGCLSQVCDLPFFPERGVPAGFCWFTTPWFET